MNGFWNLPIGKILRYKVHFQKSGRVSTLYTDSMPLCPRRNTNARKRPEEQVAVKKYISMRD